MPGGWADPPLRLPNNAGASVDRLTIIIPALNEARGIAATLQSLAGLRASGHELIVVDGGSADGTADLVRPLVDRVLAAPAGRASQMNAGARIARGDVLLFLHADSLLPAGADRLVSDGLAASGRDWGRFDLEIDGAHPLLRLVEAMMNWRSRLTGVCTGDQGLFVRRAAFEASGGFAAVELMEDIELCTRLRRISSPLVIRARILTSARRWEKHGVLRTIVLMWWLRLQYFAGVSPARLAKSYAAQRR